MSDSSTNQNNAALSRKEFVNRLNRSGDFPHFKFDALRFQLTTEDGESIKLADFFTEHLARYSKDDTVNSDWIFEELRNRLSHRDEVRPAGAESSITRFALHLMGHSSFG